MNTYEIGSKVQARDFSEMLYLCDTYHSKVDYGLVVDVYPEYAAGIVVQWVGIDGEGQNMTYLVEPEQLVAA